MFFVDVYNPLTADFETIGAFSKKDEAEAFARKDNSGRTTHVTESDFQTVLDRAVQARWERLAQVSAKSEPPVKELRVTLALDTQNLVEALRVAAIELSKPKASVKT